MARIGGNTAARLERCTKTVKNDLGEDVQSWTTVGNMIGWLDMYSESTGPNYGQYHAAIAESSHVYLTDYNAIIAGARYDTCRAIINGQIYAVKMIDDPMELHRHLEIYLKHTGGQ